MLRLSKVVLGVLTVVLAAGCSGGSSSRSSAPTSAGATSAAGAGPSGPSAGSGGGTVRDPCTLITPADAGAVMGGSVAPSTSSFTGVYQACTYETAAGPLLVTSRLIDQAAFDRSIKNRTGETTPLPGVCSEASSSGPIVLGWKNGTEVDIQVLTVTSGAAASAKTLAIKACARL